MSLAAFTKSGRFYRGNLHTHSTLSDGRLSAEEVCRRYAAREYDFICLSDHFLAEYGFPVSDTRAFRSNEFTTILGAEVHAGAISHGDPWHLLAVGLPLDFAPTTDGESGPDLAQRCVDAGAFIAIAHPQWYGLQPDEARTITSAHAVEIYNHSSAVHTTREDGTYVLDELLNDGRRLTAIATDDAHFQAPGYEDHGAFGGWVMVKAEANTPEDLLAALKAGEYYASTGPEIHDITISGDQLEISCSTAVNIMVLGRGSKSEHTVGAAQTRAKLGISRFRGDWCRVVVIDSQGKCAWSNPIWPE